MAKYCLKIALLLAGTLLMAGCERTEGTVMNQTTGNGQEKAAAEEGTMEVFPENSITRLEDGLSAVRVDGDYGFEGFLAQGGASSDREVVRYLAQMLSEDTEIDGLLGNVFGCSTIAAMNPNGNALFGRNFDWNPCEALVVAAYPENAYASLSTVNTDFITQGAGSMARALQMERVKTIASLYAPLDGMNEAGLAVSVNMIQDGATIAQDTEKPDITTTTAVRLLLDYAANVDEALELLGRYDLHASMGMMVHFAIADAQGNSVVVEYIDNEMVVTETPVVTNFYLAEGEKHGIGTEQSHRRYDILMERLRENGTMTEEQVRDALDSVSKDNFGDEFASTEWSIVFQQGEGKAQYFHRENYEKRYLFTLERQKGADR